MARTVGKVLKVAGMIALAYVSGGTSLGLIAAGSTIMGMSVAAFTMLAAGATVVGSLLAPPSPPEIEDQGRILNLSTDSTAPRRILYGRAATGGTLVFRDSTGVSNEDLHLVIALAGHQVDGFEKLRFGESDVSFDGNGQALGTYQGYMWREIYDGNDTQAASTSLVNASPIWTGAHRLRGIAYTYLRLKWDQTVYPQGLEKMLFTLRGRRIYDPRLDSTNGGAGAHRLNDPQTWTWSDNAVLCVIDYVKGIYQNGKLVAGMGIDPARIDWPNIIAEANIADELIPLAAGGTERRYCANGWIDPTRSHRDNVSMLSSACGGTLIFQGGKWCFYVASARPISVSRGANDIVGPISLQAKKSAASKVNCVRGVFSDPQSNYQLTDYPPIQGSTYLTEDGGQEHWFDLNLPFTKSPSCAQRLAKIALRRGRLEKAINVTFSLAALRDQAMDALSFSYENFNLNNQKMLVADWQIAPTRDPNGQFGLVIQASLIEDDDAIYDWNEAVEEASHFAGGLIPMAQRRFVPLQNLPGSVDFAAQVSGSSKPAANADVTSQNTAADTSNVAGRAASLVRDDALLGSDLTRNSATKIHSSSLSGIYGGGLTYAAGDSIEALKPAQAGAMANSYSTSIADPVGGTEGDIHYNSLYQRFSYRNSVGWQTMADTTAVNTSADTTNVAGRTASLVRDDALLGSDLTRDSATKIHSSSLSGIYGGGLTYAAGDPIEALKPAQAGATVGATAGPSGNLYGEGAQKLTDAQIITALGQAATVAAIDGYTPATIRAWSQTGNDLTLDNLVKLHPSSLPDGLYTIGGITYIDQIYQANGEYLWNTDGAAGVQIVAGADAGGFYFGCGAANDTRPIFIGQSGYTPYIQFSGGTLFVNPTYNYKAVVIRNTKENSQSAIELQTYSGLFAGELYGATSGEIGFLNSGGGWSMRWNYVYDWFSVTTRFRYGIINQYNDSDSYRGFLGWNTLQFGNNGQNNLVAGNTYANGSFYFYVNNTSDLAAGGAINGTLAAVLDAAGNAIFYQTIYTNDIRFYNSSTINWVGHTYHNNYEIYGVSKYKLYSGAYIGNHPNNAYFAFSSATGVYGAILGYSNNQSVFHGYYYWDLSGIGIVNSSGQWVFLAHMGNAGFEMRHNDVKVFESNASGVTISSYAYAVDVYATSLREWKRDIETVSLDVMHELLMGMNPCTHGWNPKFGPANDTSIRHLGFIQDEMKLLWPELTEHSGITYQKITVPLVAGYQRHEGQIKALQEENARVWAALRDVRNLVLQKVA